MERLKQLDPAHAVCFSGHRPDRLLGQGNPAAPETQKLIAALNEEIKGAISRGKNTFINGLMAGWDILASEQVISLKELYPQIRLVTIAPYKEQFFTREKCWTPEWVNRAKGVCRLHNYGVTLAERYRAGIYYERNRALVDNSSELICFWDSGKGGTGYTVRYAESKGVSVCNLCSGRLLNGE